MIDTEEDRQEAARLIALTSCNIMDTPVEKDYDHLTELAQLVFEAPIVLITLLDSSRLWFKSARGVSSTQIPREQAFCRYNLDPHDMLVVDDLKNDERFASSNLVVGPPHVRFYAGAPLVLSDGFVLGSFCILDTKPRTLTEREREMLRHFARLSVERIELHRRVGLDWLTGTLTKSALQTLSQEMLVSVAAGLITASTIAIDIDHFKAVNDTHGHQAGDQVLARVANACQAALRKADIMARAGGEEFVVLLPGLGPAEAEAVAQRLRLSVAAMDLSDIAPGLSVTASFGVTEVRATDPLAEAFLGRADEALYLSKRNGRNRVTVSGELRLIAAS